MLLVLLVFIASLLVTFSVLIFHNAYKASSQITIETNSAQSLGKISCRVKRSLTDNIFNRKQKDSAEDDEDEFEHRDQKFVIKSNLLKRQSHDDITNILRDRLKEVNKNKFEYRRNLQNSIEKFEKKLADTEDFFRDINANMIDDENSLMIAKNLHDMNEELSALDNDIVSLLESSNLIDTTVRKRIRHKRSLNNIQQKFEEVREEFIRCKKSTDGTNKNDCDKVYRKVMNRFKEITRKFQEIEKIVNDMDIVDIKDRNEKDKKKLEEKNSSEQMQTTISEIENSVTSSFFHKTIENDKFIESTISTKKNPFRKSDDKSIENEEEKVQVKLQSAFFDSTEETTACPAMSQLNSFLPNEIKKHPKVIEDLHDFHHFNSKLDQHHPNLNLKIEKRIHGEVNYGIRDIIEDIKDLIEDGLDHYHNEDLHKNSLENNLGATRETSFTSLCQNLNAKIAEQQTPVQNHPHSHFMPVTYSGSFPVTAEASKGTSKVVMNPQYNLNAMPYPVCFMQYPQQYRAPYFYPNVMPMPVINAPTGAFFIPSGRPLTVPTFLSRSNDANNINKEDKNQKAYCTFMPNEQNNLPVYFETSTAATTFHDSNRQQKENDNDTTFNIPTQFDIIYATYPNQIFSLGQSNSYHCDEGKLPCFNSNQCILKSKWCDSVVDCADASDETACSCKARLDKSRICDGFVDCPMASDELGCFGCDKFQYSCFDTINEYESSLRSSLSCYSSVDHCDGFINCKNGRDERDCNIIINQIGTMTAFSSSSSEGILHRNFKGRWYPVCKNPMRWAYEACEIEVGKGEPKITVEIGQINGPFIQPGDNEAEHPEFSDFCQLSGTSLDRESENNLIHVKCIQPKCGISKNFQKLETEIEKRNVDQNMQVQEARIVGGVTARPMEFPFIVAIFKDGKFHCGGSIYNENWIITAAHCCRLFENHYYEIHSGFLRRLSFSPMIQITKVLEVIIHENYDRITMRHDIALMKVENQFKFNKWIRPICMPSQERIGINDWMYGPKPGTVCSALGWGSILERGPEPDELHVVEIPILSKCKHMNDQESGSICAGEAAGLRDACQGDSGGPLVCRSALDSFEWYLAGIVSHGEGCARANEPGVYTRTSLYLDWIDENTNLLKTLPQIKPKSNCPGMNCVWGNQKCITASSKCDRYVDCLGGEDEVECQFNWMNIFGLGNTNIDKNRDIDPNENNAGKKISKKLSKKNLKSDIFRCEKISQIISIDQRCDKHFDCEDGTDEFNCTCRDHLKGQYSKLICDGHIDCADLTDETDCLTCEHSEFSCPLSKKCIKKTQQCDEIIDCKHAEDEHYCLALTDGHSVTLDVNGMPHFHNKGIVAKNIKSKWSIFCDDNESFLTNATSMANDICHILGFKSHKNVRAVNMKSDEVKTMVDARSRHQNGEKITCNFVESCLALEIECLPYTKNPIIPKNLIINDQFTFVPHQNNPRILRPLKTISILKEFEPPWNVEIFSNGDLVNFGFLLEKSWVLTELSILGNDENPLKNNHVVALIGNSKSEINIQSPYEQISTVDCVKKLTETNFMMLHLKNEIKFNRHVMPIFLPNKIDVNETCIAISMNEGRLKSFQLKKDNCKDCYKAINSELDEAEICKDHKNAQGIASIICRSTTSGWYPKGFYQMKQGFCDFITTVTVKSLDNSLHQINKIIENPTCEFCINHSFEIHCKTHRCPLGKCLQPFQVCNKIADCHDASDETTSMCEQRSQSNKTICHHYEFNCHNGKCVEKSKFCNQFDDCGDKSDEPSECTCFDYLKITQANKLCDGIVHCWDRTDENIAYCGNNCNDKMFKCEGTKQCIPHELVCDSRIDCSNGFDERNCHGINKIVGSDGFYEVLQRTYGLWHTKCFPHSTPPDHVVVEELCNQLELNSPKSKPQARLKISEKSIDEINLIPIEFHNAENATKVVLYSKFSPTKISKDFTVHIKTDKPLAKIVKWDENDAKNCYKMEIKC
ncbi:hypothetical protein PVAND_014416 [Polypedilum vanderplanki]|uniref:limulus clotting factor C n=1 Tax=Polypedilum vanderplanki TaxID=319348 RepID=A0A9J6BA49_POLVA|nr:hypothetical protein PVAND_014416 [Polypedilum vanderplanki]